MRMVPKPHSVAAEVHIGRGLQQDHLGVLDATSGNEPVALVLPLSPYTISKNIDYFKADVMPRLLIFGADVTKSND